MDASDFVRINDLKHQRNKARDEAKHGGALILVYLVVLIIVAAVESELDPDVVKGIAGGGFMLLGAPGGLFVYLGYVDFSNACGGGAYDFLSTLFHPESDAIMESSETDPLLAV